eukprot:1085072-Amphidinium_carterae.1
MDTRTISSHSPLLNHLLHHTSWLLNCYPRHNDGKTSYKRNWKRPYQQQIVTFGEKVYIEKITAENQKLQRRNQEQKTTGQHITLSTEFGKQLSRTILRLPKDQQFDKKLLLQVTSIEGEYDNSRKKTDKDRLQIPQQLFELKSPALPNTKTTPSTSSECHCEWHYSPPDQPPFDPTQRAPKFPQQPKPESTVQPPPGLPQPVETMPESTLPTTDVTTEKEEKNEQVTTPPPQLPAQQVRRRMSQ